MVKSMNLHDIIKKNYKQTKENKQNKANPFGFDFVESECE